MEKRTSYCGELNEAHIGQVLSFMVGCKKDAT